MILLLQYTLLFASVLLLVALGGCFSEHSGVINLGLEGIMVIGALGGALTMRYLPAGTSNFVMVLLVILASIAGGMLYSVLLAVSAINCKADQTIVGTAMNILGTVHCSSERCAKFFYPVLLFGEIDFSHGYFPQFFFHLVCEADRPYGSAFFPPVIHRDYPVRVFHHIAVAVGVDAGLVFFPYHDDITTSLQHFIGPPLCSETVQPFLIRDYGNQFQ